MGAACVTLQILCPGCIVQLQVGGGGRVAKVTGAAPSGYPTTDKEQHTSTYQPTLSRKISNLESKSWYYLTLSDDWVQMWETDQPTT